MGMISDYKRKGLGHSVHQPVFSAKAGIQSAEERERCCFRTVLGSGIRRNDGAC